MIRTLHCGLLCSLLLTALQPASAENMDVITFQQVLDLPARKPDSIIPYGDDPAQFGELWLPAHATSLPAPLVILIHGRCWQSAFARPHTHPVSAALADGGYAVWAIEYRRIGDPGGGWPGTFKDVAAAVDFADTLNEKTIDRDRVLLVGHSAGGHLASWAASRTDLPRTSELYSSAPLKVAGITGLAAIVDLEKYALGASSCERATIDLMGGTPGEVPGRYRQASPRRLAQHPNTWMVHGINDLIVPIDQLTGLRLPRSRMVTVPGAGHFDLIYPASTAFEAVKKTIAEALSQ